MKYNLVEDVLAWSEACSSRLADSVSRLSGNGKSNGKSSDGEMAAAERVHQLDMAKEE